MAEIAPASMIDVSKWYGRVAGLVHADFEVHAGITGLLGPNGAGKSTILKLLTGQLTPSLGRVRVFGEDIRRSLRARRMLGYVPDVDALYEDLDGRSFVSLLARMSGLSRGEARAATEDALGLAGALEFASQRLRTLSKGQRQRVKIAQALVHDPELLVLDEPLSGIDPTGRRELLELLAGLRDRGKTVLLSTHILHEIEAVTDRIVLVAKGRVLATGSLREIRSLLREYPLKVRIELDGSGDDAPGIAEQGAAARILGARLIERGWVTGWSEREASAAASSVLVIETRDSDRFFAGIVELFLELDLQLVSLTPLDEGAEAVFGYLLRRHESGLRGDAP